MPHPTPSTAAPTSTTSTPATARRRGRRRTAWFGAPALAAGLALGSLVGPTAVAEEQPSGQAAPTGVVALGDSYSSGLGAGGYTDACDRTPHAWGQQIFGPAVTDRTLLACSGAQLPQVRSQIAALADLPGSGRLVTVTVGGNDAGFADELQTCLLSFRSCTGREAEITARIDALEPGLASAYADLRAAAPNDRVVAGGYPLLVPDPAVRTGCTALTFAISNAERDMIRRLGVRMNDVIDDAAATAGVESVTTELEQVFTGHEACANSSTDWLYGLRLGFGEQAAVGGVAAATADQPGGTVLAERETAADPLAQFVSESFHPTLRGQQAYADAFTSVAAG